MVKIHYTFKNSKKERVPAEVTILSEESIIELRIHANDKFYIAILGMYFDGNYICIPRIGFGCKLEEVNQWFYNSRNMMKFSMCEDDALAIATALAEVGVWLGDDYKQKERILFDEIYSRYPNDLPCAITW